MEEYIIESLEFDIELDRIRNRSILETDLTNLLFMESGEFIDKISDIIKNLLKRIKEMMVQYTDQFKIKMDEYKRHKVMIYAKKLIESGNNDKIIIMPDIDSCIDEYHKSVQKFQKVNIKFLKKENTIKLSPLQAEKLVTKMIKEIEKDQDQLDKLMKKQIKVTPKEFLDKMSYQEDGIQSILIDYRKMIEESIQIVEKYQRKIDFFNDTTGRIGYPSNLSDYLNNLTKYVKRNADVIGLSIFSNIIFPKIMTKSLDILIPDTPDNSDAKLAKYIVKTGIVGGMEQLNRKNMKLANYRNNIY